MAKISIKRRNESERIDGRAALYAVIYIQRTKIRIPLDIAVIEEEWDPVKEIVKGRGADARDKNLIISNARARISDIYVRARLTGETLTRESFMAQYKRPAETGVFVDFARRHLDSVRKALSWETQKQHTAVLKKLDNYYPGATFGDITLEFLRVYAVYLRDTLGNNTTTVGKNMSVLRLYFNAAIRAGKIQQSPFDQYRIPRAQPSVVFLTEEELNTLIETYKGETLVENEHEALRFFLFMTFTGMHISDARVLQIEQIFGGEIHYTRIKTRTKVAVPLSRPAQLLVEHYQEGRYRGKLFRHLFTDQAFNRLIKRVCMRVGITKAVSAKAARHTFATLYYKKNSGDLGTLSKLLGHTNINTTMVYAHIMKDNRQAGVSVFNDFL